MVAIIRPLTEPDLRVARRIICTSFGTFLGAPDPENFLADRDYVYGRFGAEHVSSFGAELDGELVAAISRHAGGASGSSDRLRFVPTAKHAGSQRNSSRLLLRNSIPGALDTPAFLPSHRARSTWRSIRNTAFTLDF